MEVRCEPIWNEYQAHSAPARQNLRKVGTGEEEEGGSIAGSVGSTVVVTLEVENKREGEGGPEGEVKSEHQIDSAGTVNDVFNK